MSELGLSEALGRVGDDASLNHVEVGDITERLGRVVATVVFDGLLAFLDQDVLDEGGGAICCIDIDRGVIERHLGTTVKHLNLLGHGI